MPAAEHALSTLAAQLRAGDSVISPAVADPGAVEPALGLLAAAGPRAADRRGEYALLVESIREGYLLHYGEPRVVRGADDDLALLAGDYLYALGLERLAALGDLESIRELSDLISLSAQLHAEAGRGVQELWLAAVTVVAAGSEPGYEEAKAELRRGRHDAREALWDRASAIATGAGIGDALNRAAEAIGFHPR